MAGHGIAGGEDQAPVLVRRVASACRSGCERLTAACAVIVSNDVVELLPTAHAFGITGRSRVDQNIRISYRDWHAPGSRERRQSGVACEKWMRSLLLTASKSSPFTTRNEE